MSPQISIPGLEDDFKTHLPEELRVVYEPLFKDTIWLTSKWTEYCKLYGNGKETVDLLNRHAGYLFLIIQDTLWDDVVLHITRLIAPLKTINKFNLTVLLLPGLISDTSFRSKVELLVAECVAAGEFAQTPRNKRIAHTDRDLALSSEPLLGNSRLQINAFLAALHTLLQAIYQHFINSHYDFSMQHIGNDAHSLIGSLRRADARAL